MQTSESHWTHKHTHTPPLLCGLRNKMEEWRTLNLPERLYFKIYCSVRSNLSTKLLICSLLLYLPSLYTNFVISCMCIPAFRLTNNIFPVKPLTQLPCCYFLFHYTVYIWGKGYCIYSTSLTPWRPAPWPLSCIQVFRHTRSWPSEIILSLWEKGIDTARSFRLERCVCLVCVWL